ncbi:MAG: LysR family transcriptional regulator [Armatimonadetes bacterium]|nr:LysR family transcriptional regulator [Armatimonadota bacterium]
MAILWTICGAGRGVGKTHLALSLCNNLPNAVYVKLGSGRPRPDKHANLTHTQQELDAFINAYSNKCKHIIAEATALARTGKGDLIIFIDAPANHPDPRSDRDQLFTTAHIKISPESNARDWENILQAKLEGPDLTKRVLAILLDQRRFIIEQTLRVRSRIWFAFGERRVFGPGIAKLLDGIDQLGSLAEAARSAKISYRRAWDLVKEAEAVLGMKLVEPRVGGNGGGGSKLSDSGRKLLDAFNVLSHEVAAYADRRFTEIVGDWTSGKQKPCDQH